MKNWILPMMDHAKAEGPWAPRIDASLTILRDAESTITPASADFTVRLIELMGEIRKYRDYASALCRELPSVVTPQRLAAMRVKSPFIEANSPTPGSLELVVQHEFDHEETVVVRAGTDNAVAVLPAERDGGLPAELRRSLAAALRDHARTLAEPDAASMRNRP